MVEPTDGVSLIVSHDKGRPPESISHVDFNQPLERVGSPLAAEDQPVVKRGRNDSVIKDTMEGSETMEMEADGLLSTKEQEAVAGDDSTGAQPRVSYAHVVRDSLREKDPTHVPEELSPDKIIVRDEDCVVDHSGRFPRISFAESVHAQIDLIQKGEIQLIDLDNNYFLVRLEDPRDYERSLTEGPWTIFGCYLTVQPWSRAFNTSEKHPSHVVAWVRLPGLPYRYYTKALFRRIAAVIGTVVKVDYNTDAGERGKFARLAIMVDLNKPLVPCIGIDGFVQRLEYEGLQNICYNCGVYGHGREACPQLSKSAPPVNETVSISTTTGPDLNACNIKNSKELFGPWMVVDNKRRRTPTNKQSGWRHDLVMTEARGSRFAVLDACDMIEDTITGKVEVSPQTSDVLAPTGTDMQVASVSGVVRSVTAGIQLPQRKPRSSPALSSRIKTIPMLPGNDITVVEHRPHGASKDHQAVSLLEKGHGSSGLDTGKSQVGRGFKLKQAKEHTRQGLMIRKPSPAKTISRPVLSDWVDNVNQQLNSIAHRKELDPGEKPKIILTNEGVLDVISTSQTIPGRSSQHLKVGNTAGDRDGSLGHFWLLAFPNLIKHAGESFPESAIAFLLTTYQPPVETLRYKVDVGFECLEELEACKTSLETIRVSEMASRRDCFQAVEEAPIGNNGPLGVAENGKPEKITRTEDNSSEHAAKAIVERTRKRKEWTRTLAYKLFQERHSYNGDGGGEGEAMDLLWEVFETDSDCTAEVKSGFKEGGSNSSGYYYCGDESYDERELNAQLCCFQTLKLAAGNLNLGKERPKPNLFKKISKGFGLLRFVRTMLGKKWY
ncbi:hypothetical protein GQ457_06G028150 [Hibiscus cannabinus]